MTTIQPYPSGTQWNYTNREYRTVESTDELVLYWEPNGSPISDDYSPEEASAPVLWRMWVDRYADAAHRQRPDLYQPGEVPILWSVTTPEVTGVFEAAPHTVDRRGVDGWHGVQEHFLTFFTDPVHAETEERLNWARLPVLDFGWKGERVDKGGFVQEATGWKPSPLQETVNVRQLGAAAGLYVPELVAS